MKKSDLKKQMALRCEQSKQLKNDYSEVYDQIVVYVKTTLIDEWDAEEILSDILLILLDAQERGDSTTKVLGPNYKYFCDQMMAPFKSNTLKTQLKSNGHLILLSLNISIFFSWFIGLNFKKILAVGTLTTFNLSLAFILSLFGLTIGAWLILARIHSDAFKKNGFASALISGGIFTIVMFATALLYKATEQIVILKTNTLWMVGVMAIIGIVDYLQHRNSTLQAPSI